MMKHFQLLTLLFPFLLAPNFVYAANNHDHINEVEKHHEHKQDEGNKSDDDQQEHDSKHDDHSDDKHDHDDEHHINNAAPGL